MYISRSDRSALFDSAKSYAIVARESGRRKAEIAVRTALFVFATVMISRVSVIVTQRDGHTIRRNANDPPSGVSLLEALFAICQS